MLNQNFGRWGGFVPLPIPAQDPAELVRNMLREQQSKLPQLPSETVSLFGCSFSLPLCDAEKLGAAIEDALKLGSNLDMEKVSLFMRMIIERNEAPTNIKQRIVLTGTASQGEGSMFMKEEALKVLQMFYPKKDATAFELYLTRNDWWLPSIVKEFGVPTAPAKQKSPLVIRDAVVAIGLRSLYDAEQEKQRKLDEQQREEMRVEKAKLEGDFFECGCCCCDVPFDDLLQCPEGHLFCKACVERQIETAIGEGRTTIKCLSMDGCENCLTIAELERSIPESTMKRLFQTETMNALFKADLEGIVKCHKCGYMVFFEGHEVPMVCPECKAKTCALCGEAYHHGMTCEQMKEIDKNRLVEEKMNEAVVRTCPKCQAQFVKEEGCNKMECPRCGSWICYLCKQIIPKDVGYNHFWRNPGVCPPDKCPLWVSNEALHLMEAEDAKELAKEEVL